MKEDDFREMLTEFVQENFRCVDCKACAENGSSIEPDDWKPEGGESTYNQEAKLLLRKIEGSIIKEDFPQILEKLAGTISNTYKFNEFVIDEVNKASKKVYGGIDGKNKRICGC